jgi:hypothetical protein
LLLWVLPWLSVWPVQVIRRAPVISSRRLRR